MSRGPGRIERAIRALFDAHPDEAFVTDELAEHCYPNARPIERRHQVAVLRAAHCVIERDPNWHAFRDSNGTMFCNLDSVESYGTARLIGRSYWHAKSERWAKRYRWWWSPEDVRRDLLRDRERLLEYYADQHREDCAPGGLYHGHVLLHRAERDGDEEAAAAIQAGLKAQAQAGMAQIMAGITGSNDDKRCLSPAAGTEETLIAIAARLRALMVQNDPDVMRAGLTEIADALDATAGNVQDKAA